MTLPSIEAVVESFKEKFAVEYHDEQGDFLRTTLTTHQEQVIKACVEVLEARKFKFSKTADLESHGAYFQKGYNSALTDAQTKLLDLTSKV